jgi:hypothetical protein
MQMHTQAHIPGQNTQQRWDLTQNKKCSSRIAQWNNFRNPSVINFCPCFSAEWIIPILKQQVKNLN